MKKLKAKLYSLLAISLGLVSMPMNAATTPVNVPLVNEAWTFIGVPGFQTYGATSGTSSISWGSANFRIIDGAGPTFQIGDMEVPTWDGNYSNPVPTSGTTASQFDDDVTPRPVGLNGRALGDNMYSTVGVLTLGVDVSEAKSSTTNHLGAVLTAIEYTPRIKNMESPIRTMYIQSPDASSPDIKIYYQADYEGESLLFQYETGTANTLSESDNTTYQVTFNRAYTYENYASLTNGGLTVVTAQQQVGLAGNSINGVLHSYDHALKDNNISTSGKNNLIPMTAYSAFNGTTYPPASYLLGERREVLDGNLTVLGWDSTAQQWRFFRAYGDGTAITLSDANDFDTFEQGKGYWAKLQANTGTGGTLDDPAGFVLGYDSAADINHSSFISDGWNMLSFGDEYLSYSITGIIITDDGAGAVGDLNITDTYGASTLSFSGAAADLFLPDTPVSACNYFNRAVDGNNSRSARAKFLVKCFADETNNRVVLLSTRRFTVQSDSATTTVTDLLGIAISEESNGTQNNFYRSQYGVNGMIIEPNTYFNTVTGVDANMSVEFVMSGNDEEYAAIDNTLSVANIQNAMDAQFATATNNVIPIDMDGAGGDDSVLMVSDYRFFVKDATLTRIFSYDTSIADSTRANAGKSDNDYTGFGTVHNTDLNNTSIRVVMGSASDYVTLWDDNLTQTVKNIEAGTNTDVNATLLDPSLSSTGLGDMFMLTYTGASASAASGRVSFVDIQEQGGKWDVLVEKECQNYTSTIRECNASTRGAIGKAWNISRVVSYTEDANDSNHFDGNYTFPTYSDNLGNTPFYAENFPVDGPLYDIKTGYGKKAELIITGQTSTGGLGATSYISWKQIDVSKDPTEWYDDDDQFELFWTEKEQGYWVYLNGEATSNIDFVAQTNGTNFTLTGSPYAHFTNHFAGTATTSTTLNHLDNYSLQITASGLTTYASATANNDAWEVYATINGFATSLQRTGSTNDFTISIDSHETEGIGFNEGEVTLTITLAEASGQTTSSTYLLDYQKPVVASSAQVGSTINLTMTTTDTASVEVYSGDINDSYYGQNGTNYVGEVTTIADPIAVNLGALGVVFPSTFGSATYTDFGTYDSGPKQLSSGIVKDIRLVAIDTSDLYSDQQKFAYIPFYAGTGILSHADGDTNVYDSYPTVYDSTGATVDTYDGTVDDGVQMKSASADRLTCVYYHQDAKLDSQTPNARELVLSDLSTTLGTIEYVDEYVGQPFVCQTASGALYVGAFLDEGEFHTDGTTTASEYQIVLTQISGVTTTVTK